MLLNDGRVDINAVLGHCRERLADFQGAQYVSTREEPLPRSPGGKVVKTRLRDETTLGMAFAELLRPDVVSSSSSQPASRPELSLNLSRGRFCALAAGGRSARRGR